MSWGGARAGAGKPKKEPSTVVRLPLPIAAIAKRMANGNLRGGDVRTFLGVEARTMQTVPLAGYRVPAGFPSPADDHLDRPLDFNELLIVNPSATFVVEIEGVSMIGAGIFPGDYVVVDRSVTASDNLIVLAVLNGEFTVKRYRTRGGKVWLEAANPEFKPVTITAEMSFEVWGVIRRSIRKL